jgi:hypothetical protein
LVHHQKVTLLVWEEVQQDLSQEAILDLHKYLITRKSPKMTDKMMPRLMIISSISGKDIKVLCLLRILLMKKIDKHNRLMIIVREKWTNEGPNNGNKH